MDEKKKKKKKRGQRKDFDMGDIITLMKDRKKEVLIKKMKK
jgi:hypothetical protein